MAGIKEMNESLAEFLSTGLFDNLNNLLSETPNDAYPDAWTAVLTGANSVFNSILFPIGIGFCTIYFLISLLDKVSMEQLNIEQFMKQFLKFIVVIYICQHSISIIEGLLAFGQSIYNKISAPDFLTSSGEGSTLTYYQNLVDSCGDGFTKQFPLLMKLLIPAGFNLFLQFTVTWICYSRIIEIYLKAMFMPISVADIFVGGANSSGFKYIKGFLALCLQGVMIFIINYIYTFISGNILNGINNDTGYFTVLVGTIGVGLAAVGLMKKSFQLTQEVVGA